MQKYQARVDAEDPYPEETIRQLVARIQRCDAAAPPAAPDGLVIVVDWQASRVVTVYTTDRANPRVVRA